MNKSELPAPFKTWIEFYDAFMKLGYPAAKYVILLSDGEVQIEDDQPAGCEFAVSYIKQNAFEELLAERFEYNEAKDFFTRINLIVFDIASDKVKAQLKKMKRIILTQSKKDGK